MTMLNQFAEVNEIADTERSRTEKLPLLLPEM